MCFAGSVCVCGLLCALVSFFLLCLVLSDGKLQRCPEASGLLWLLLGSRPLGHRGVDTQLSVIHQGTGEAGQVQVRRQLDALGKPRLRQCGGAEGGAGGRGGAGLALFCSGLLHGRNRQTPAFQLDCDVTGGVTTGVQGHQEVAVVSVGLLHIPVLLCGGELSLLLSILTQPGRESIFKVISP